MGREIERKFLAADGPWREAAAKDYRQGYLSLDPERTVRVRIGGRAAFLTVKGKSQGAARSEFEYQVPMDDAEQMLSLCHQPLIEKRRYVYEHAGMTWEVDEFFGANQGLLLAELELDSEDQSFVKPDWVRQEVTHDPRYYNSQLVVHPYAQWK